jgi:choline dehydrogenase
VRIRSAEPHEYPAMVGNYLQTQTDRDTIVEALKQGRRIVRSEPIRSMIVEETRPGRETSTDEQLLEYAKATGESVYHLVGTCHMGPESDRLAVVDDRLRVRGIGGLRVADASIMPRITSGNTNATCIAIGEKASAMIADDAKAARAA